MIKGSTAYLSLRSIMVRSNLQADDHGAHLCQISVGQQFQVRHETSVFDSGPVPVLVPRLSEKDILTQCGVLYPGWLS